MASVIRVPAQTVIKVPSDQKVVSQKKLALETFFGRAKLAALPKSCSRNTLKEETLLEYVEDFRRQFVQLFPTRRPLFLCPLNECGVRKFVCTTLHPTQLPFHNMYNLKDIAGFVSDYISYTALDDPLRLPEYLPSSASVMKLRSGDCFDFSVLLCSLLRGAGYNAYCVSGYAPQWVTQLDQSRVECPAELLGNAEEPKDAGTDPAELKYANRYPLKQRIEHRSKYIEAREKEATDASDRVRNPSVVKPPEPAAEASDPHHGQRVHCWVMVLKGKREVTHDCFIEPSTGAVYSVEDSPYTGVESMWNEHNYWANVQEPEKTPQAMEYTLSNTDLWEYVLIEEKTRAAGDHHDFDAVDDKLNADDQYDDRDILDAPVSWAEKISVDRESFQARYPSRQKRLVFKRCLVDKFSAHLDGAEELLSRVTLLDSDDASDPQQIKEIFGNRMDKLRQRNTFPRERRVVELYRPGRDTCLMSITVIEGETRIYEFFPGARDDGMIRREEHFGTKIIEIFDGRDDFLVYRSIAFDTPNSGSKLTLFTLEDVRDRARRDRDLPVRKITEKFARNPARSAESDVRKRTHFVADQTIRLDYHYGESHITHSVELIDKSDKDVVAEDRDRDDDLYGRGARRGAAGAGGASAGHVSGGPGSKSLLHRVDPTWKKPGPGQQREEIARLLTLEKRLMAEVREEEDKVKKDMTALEQEKRNVEPERTIYEIAREESAKEESKELKREAAGASSSGSGEAPRDPKSQVDYLTPFLINYSAGRPLLRAQALRAKEECLQALKDRLLDRAAIIQAHLDAENQKLHQRQQLFKRQAGAGAVEADEEFTKYYEQAMFRIDILKARLQRHENLALERYIEMDRRLSEDPRLAVLRQPERP